MKWLKISNLIVTIMSASFLMIIVPFLYFYIPINSHGWSAQFKFKIDGDLGVDSYGWGSWILDSQGFPVSPIGYGKMTAQHFYQLVQILIISGAVLMLVFETLSLIKNKKTASTFKWFYFFSTAFTVSFAIFRNASFTGSVLISFGGIYWLISVPVILFAFVNVTLTIMIEIRRYQANGVVQQQVIYQNAGQHDSASVQNHGSASPLTDSVEIKRRIESLKSGLNMPSYDEALEVIESTGEWQGLNMKDVQDYDYERELRQNQQRLAPKKDDQSSDTFSH